MKAPGRKTEFARHLVQLRTLAGFESGWKFYHANGGRAYWLFTYVQYSRIENGQALPKPESLTKFVKALRFAPGHAQIVDFYKAYMFDHVGGGPTAQLLMDTILSGAKPLPVLPDRAKLIKVRHSAHLTLAHLKALAQDKIACWCNMILSAEDDPYTPAELAELLDVSVPEAVSALELLLKAGLVDKARHGGYVDHFHGKTTSLPPALKGMQESHQVLAHVSELANRQGRSVMKTVSFIRAEKADLDIYCTDLSNMVTQAVGYGSPVKSDTTALYLVEARVVKVGRK